MDEVQAPLCGGAGMSQERDSATPAGGKIRMESRRREDMNHLDERVGRLEHSQAKLEGIQEGLREAITRQLAA